MFFSSDGFVTRIEEVAGPIHSTYGSDLHDSYDTITDFVEVFQNGFLVLTLIILVIAGLVYSQRKRAEDFM